MPWPTAEITAPHYALIRGTGAQVTYSSDARVFVWPTTTIFAARVNGAVSTSAFGFVNWDTATVGAYTDIEVGMTIYISATNDITKAYWFGIIQGTPAATTLYVNEISQPIADNDYIFVTEDFRIRPKLAFENFGVQSKYFNISFRQIPPYFTLLKSVYATEVLSGVGSFSFDATAQAATSGATIGTYLWDVEDGTITVGSTSTAAITATFPQGKRYISCTATDSGGRTTTIHIPVVVNGPSFPSTLNVRNIQIARRDGDMSCTLTADDGVELSTVLDGSLVVVYFATENLNGTTGSLYDNVLFVGRLRQENTPTVGDEQFAVVSETQFNCDGPLAQLARIHGASIAMRNISSPTVWDEINDYTSWRGLVHFLREHTTFLELHSLQFDETLDSTYESTGDVTQGQDALSCANSIAQGRIDARLELAPGGEARITRHALLMNSTDRNNRITVAQLTDGSSSTNADLLGYSIAMDEELTVGKAQASGGSYNTTSASVTPKIAIGPGNAQDTGSGQTQLDRQVLVANASLATVETEMRRLVGEVLARANARVRLSVQFLDSLHFLIPSQGYWHKYTLAATDNTRGRAYTTAQRWLLTSLTISIDTQLGTQTVAGEVLLETTGYPGIIFDPPVQSEIPFDIPIIPIEDAYPFALPEIPPVLDIPIEDALPIVNVDEATAPRNGNAVLFGNATVLYRSVEILRSNRPLCEDITPGGITEIKMALFNQRTGEKDGYALDSDGIESSVFHIDNILSSPDNWVQGTGFSGEFEIIRTESAGRLGVYCSNTAGDSGEETTTGFDFTTGQHDWTAADFGGTPGAIYSSGNGWGDNYAPPTTDGIFIDSPAFTSTDLLSVIVRFSGNVSGSSPRLRIHDASGSPIYGTSTDSGVSEITITCSGAIGISGFRVNFDPWVGNFEDTSLLITHISITTSSDPFASTGDAVVRFSSDDGESMGVEISVGTSPGAAGGFDIVRAGSVSFGAADTRAKIATTISGAYANAGSALTAGDPNLLIVPWNRRASATSNFGQGSATEVIIGATALNASDEALWWLDSGGTMNNITPYDGSHYGIPVGPNCLISHLGTHLAGLFLFNATRKFTTSVDAGANWTIRESVDSDTDTIIQPRSQRSALLLYYNYEGSGTGITVSPDWGVTRVRKTLPITPTYMDILG